MLYEVITNAGTAIPGDVASTSQDQFIEVISRFGTLHEFMHWDGPISYNFV